MDLLAGLETLQAQCIRLAATLKEVAIEPTEVHALAIELSASPPELPHWDHAAFPAEAGEWLDCVVLVGNAINFCYWTGPGRPMWTVTVDGKAEVDAFAVFGAVHNALQDGYDLLDGPTIAGYAHALLDSGQGVLPLRHLRERFLQQLGTLISLQFGGSLSLALASAPTSAVAFASWLSASFPCYRDARTYRTEVIHFRKRAYLAAGMLHAARVARGVPGLEGADALPVYADYMLPRALRSLGVLRLTPNLAQRIERGVRLEAQSESEVELRIATVAAGGLILKAARELGTPLNTIALDHWLWRRGLDGAGTPHPHHLTVTTDY